MHKLDNRGWGFSTFIAFIAVFIIAIILIIIGAVRLGMTRDKNISDKPITQVSPSPIATSTPNSTTNNDYMDLVNNYRTQLIDVTKDYVKNKQVVVADQDKFTVTVVSLVRENYVNKLDISGNSCTGYVVVSNNSGNYEYNSLVNCGSNYITESYDANLDESFN